MTHQVEAHYTAGCSTKAVVVQYSRLTAAVRLFECETRRHWLLPGAVHETLAGTALGLDRLQAGLDSPSNNLVLREDRGRKVYLPTTPTRE
jgi:hypothetical protein